MNETRLENLLKKAAQDSAYRPEFYDEILKSDLIVLHQPDSNSEIKNGIVYLKEDRAVKIKEFQSKAGRRVIPIFSSIEALQKGLKTEEAYLQFNARTLFEITKGASYVLNPYSDYAKEFTAGEIENLLNDTVSRDDAHVIEKDMKVLVGQPKDYPYQLANALKKYFSKANDVRSAYLMQVIIQDKNKLPHLMVGINMPSRNEKVLRNAIAVSEPFLKKGEYIDLIIINDTDNLVKDVKPFYKNTLLNRIRNVVICFLN